MLTAQESIPVLWGLCLLFTVATILQWAFSAKSSSSSTRASTRQSQGRPSTSKASNEDSMGFFLLGLGLKSSATACFLLVAVAAHCSAMCPHMASQSVIEWITCATSVGTSIGTLRWAMFAALVFGAAGDVFLVFSWGFIPGLLSFLLGHVMFCVAFPKMEFDVMAATTYSALPLIAVCTWVGSWLFPRTGPLTVPVAAYFGVIVLMVFLAAGTGDAVVSGGAWLFLVSDIGVAWAKFRRPTILSRLSLLLYYSAQLIFATLLLREDL